MEVKSGCPEDLLYADDLTLVIQTLKGLEERLEAWEGALESKGLRIKGKKTKIIINSENAESFGRKQVSLSCFLKGSR